MTKKKKNKRTKEYKGPDQITEEDIIDDEQDLEEARKPAKDNLQKLEKHGGSTYLDILRKLKEQTRD